MSYLVSMAEARDTVGDDAATFTLTFNEVERHIA